jgi:two-component system chemotaxis response regulator CheB
MIRVLLVDDSPVAITILKRMLSLSTDIAVVGTAANGREA